MSPQEARNETNLQRVRMFRAQELNKATLTEKWDRVRLVCTQPFNQHLKYGLSFVTINGQEDESTSKKTPSRTSAGLLSDLNLGLFKMKEAPTVDPIKQGTLFSRFKNQGWNSSPGTTSVGTGSKSLADVALAESEFQARQALKPSPLKDDRPAIQLSDKLKTGAAKKRILADSESARPLPSRKMIDQSPARPKVPTSRPHESQRESHSTTPKRTTPTTKVGPSTVGGSDKKDAAAAATPKRTQQTPQRGPPPSSGGAEDKSDGAVATPKRKLHTPQREEAERVVKKVKRTKTLPFGRLLEGVVAVLSGFQNPLRGQLRDRLLAMGAKYKPEWNGQCTHLVSAFANTPKFREVKGRGKIVTKDWVEQCHAQRKRLPWRRFHLDRDDKGPESEEEVWEGDDSDETPDKQPVVRMATPKTPVSAKKPPASDMRTPKTPVSKPRASNLPAEDEDDYGGSTDVDDPDTDDEIETARRNMREAAAISHN